MTKHKKADKNTSFFMFCIFSIMRESVLNAQILLFSCGSKLPFENNKTNFVHYHRQ